jgi:hypothetical protein
MLEIEVCLEHQNLQSLKSFDFGTVIGNIYTFGIKRRFITW